MEVHHHAHTARKKWTHYFWEFLMLFLAVFCGFLAENQREHYIEKQRAKQFARSLIYDLSSDTFQLASIFKLVQNVTAKYDSFLLAHKNLKPTGELYYYGSFSMEASDFTSNVSTLDQIKNSGSLRYFKPLIQDKISAYARLVDRNKDYKPFGIHIHQKSTDLWNRIFDTDIILQLNKWNRPAIDSFLRTKPALVNNDPVLMKEFSNIIIGKRKSETAMKMIYYSPAFKHATELIELLKEQYHLSEGTPLEK